MESVPAGHEGNVFVLSHVIKDQIEPKHQAQVIRDRTSVPFFDWESNPMLDYPAQTAPKHLRRCVFTCVALFFKRVKLFKSLILLHL